MTSTLVVTMGMPTTEGAMDEATLATGINVGRNCMAGRIAGVIPAVRPCTFDPDHWSAF